jgi:hypothetical protein
LPARSLFCMQFSFVCVHRQKLRPKLVQCSAATSPGPDLQQAARETDGLYLRVRALGQGSWTVVFGTRERCVGISEVGAKAKNRH